MITELPAPQPATGIAAVAPARSSAVDGWLRAVPQRVVCAPTIRTTFDAKFSHSAQSGVKLMLSVRRDGPYAIVGWEAGEVGGMALFHHRGETWCRLFSGGGAFDEADIVGFDGIDRATAHRLFHAKWATDTADAR